jgi:hypothetical protein
MDKSDSDSDGWISPLNENIAIIHVIDEAKRRQQDFKWSISKLLKHMKYFEKSINGWEDKIGLDISVHCDLETFEWLIKYIHLDTQILRMEWSTNSENEISNFDSETTASSKNGDINVLPLFDAISMYENTILKPVTNLCLNLSNIITLLVAAEYLKMDALREDCVQFIGKYFEEIWKLKINMNFLKPQTLERLSQFVDIEVLDVMRERKDKFISKLFDKKLESLLKDEKRALQRWVFWDSLYTLNTHLIWSENPNYFFDTHGELSWYHIADCEFETTKFVRFVKERYRVSWRELYWKIWAFGHSETWSKWYEEFSFPRYTFCTNNEIDSKGWLEQSGISSFYLNAKPARECFHKVKNESLNHKFQIMMKRKHIICESNIATRNYENGSEPQSEEENSKPLYKRLNHFEGMNEEEKLFFSSTLPGELLSWNYRLSLHKALQEYLMDQRQKEGRSLSQRSIFEIEYVDDELDSELITLSNFFDINIDADAITKEMELIKKRLEDRK